MRGNENDNIYLRFDTPKLVIEKTNDNFKNVYVFKDWRYIFGKTMFNNIRKLGKYI